jgi:diguanylate cyclase (GGDEF)-like protein/PAS domain S-box-containing protein
VSHRPVGVGTVTVMRDGVDQETAAALSPAAADLPGPSAFTAALLETIDVGIVSCDANGHFVVSNRAQRRLFGFEDAIDGLWMGDIDPHIDVFDMSGRRLSPAEYPLMRALRGEDVSSVDVRVGPAGGPYREVVVRATQIIGAQGELLGAVAALTDVTAERTASRALVDERRQLEEAQRIGQVGSFELDFGTEDWSYSTHLAALWGLRPEVMAPATMTPLVHEEDRERARSSWDAACRLGGSHSYEYRIHRASDGVERRLRTHVEVDLGPDGLPVLARGTQLDVTDLNRAEQAATRANAFFDAVLTASPDYTFVTDVSTGAVIYGSRDKHVLGITTDELITHGDKAVEAHAHPDHRERLQALDRAAKDLEDGSVLQVRYRAIHADGTWRWLNRRSTPFRRDDAGNVVEVLSVLRDVTDLVEAEDRLTHAAQHDHLTGLPNRGVLMQRLEAALTRSLGDGREVAVLFIDLDGFKTVNDTAGHAVGDIVLVETARRLSHVLRDDDTVARVGGDEFVVVVEPWRRHETSGSGPDDSTDFAVDVAARIIESLRRPMTVDGVSHVVTASIGLAYSTRIDAGAPGPVTAEQLLHAADGAMYVAKSLGKNTVSIHQP